MSRRRLLQFAAASPLLAYAQDSGPSKPEEMLDVFDFEAVAKRTLPPAHFGYLTTGSDDEATLRANREAFRRYQLRVRRLVNVAKLDLSIKVFGVLRHANRARAGRKPQGLSSRSGGWCGQGRQGQPHAADAFDRGLYRRRDRERSARRAGLVSALSDG